MFEIGESDVTVITVNLKNVFSKNNRKIIRIICMEAAWPSGLGRWTCNPEVPGSSPPPCHYLDLFHGRPEFISSVTLVASWDF